MRAWLVIGCVVLVVAAGAVAVAGPGGGDGGEPRTQPNRAFLSATEPDAPAVVWAVGDGADGGRAAKAVARRIEAGRPDRFLYLGDVYDRGSAREFRDNYDSVYGRLAAITAPTPGNHEWGARREGYNPYWQSKTGAKTPPWYAFRVGGWRVFSLNSEAPHGRGSEQLRWLTAEIAKQRGTCALAFWHRPLQSAGGHGDQDDVAPLWNALRGRARIVLNGHDHDLQRFRPRDGITELVIGAGGKSRYGVKPDRRAAFSDDRHFGALRMTLRPGRARLTVVSETGAVLDRSTVTCR